MVSIILLLRISAEYSRFAEESITSPVSYLCLSECWMNAISKMLLELVAATTLKDKS